MEFNLFSTHTVGVQLVTRADSEERALPKHPRALLWFDGQPFPTYRHCVQQACFHKDLMVLVCVFSILLLIRSYWFRRSEVWCSVCTDKKRSRMLWFGSASDQARLDVCRCRT